VGKVRLSAFCRDWTVQNLFRRGAALASLGLGMMTVLLFLYILLVPLIRGIEPNVSVFGTVSISGS
jgi:hypothetical protein